MHSARRLESIEPWKPQATLDGQGIERLRNLKHPAIFPIRVCVRTLDVSY